MEPLIRIRSRVVALPQENVDTDQITPARFLKTTRRDGMKAVLFADWRKDPGFALNQPGADGAAILLAGDNFGCGSSREHAPWALADWGFRVLLSTRFADIFRSNCVKNGILPAVIPAEAHRALFARVAAEPELTLEVDVAARTVSASGEVVATFELEPFVQRCLLEGLDELGYLLRHADRITSYEQTQEGIS